MSLAATLRALIGKAYPGKFGQFDDPRAHSSKGQIVEFGTPRDDGSMTIRMNAPGNCRDEVALLVTLRNAAPRLVALVEACEALKVEVKARYPGKPVSEWPKQYQDVIATLAALDGETK